MGSGTNKIKVAWICHFSNKSVRNRLKIRKYVAEFSPWISLGIEEAKKRDDIELHIVSPHPWIAWKKDYSEQNVHYHFFNSGIPFFGRHWPSILKIDYITNFYLTKKLVGDIMKDIKPDVINLHGFENAYYSSSIFQFRERYPVLVTVQGFIGQEVSMETKNRMLRKRVAVEMDIIKTFQNFGVRNRNMSALIKKINPKATLYWHEYFINSLVKEKESSPVEKKYDLIFFGRVTKEKGVEDVIKVIGKLIGQFPSLKVVIVGGILSSYRDLLTNLAVKNNCAGNIDFTGYLSTQEDVYDLLDRSRICILPTYNDIIPGTIIESMFRKVPVVSYETGGIPEINAERENISIHKPGDITSMAESVGRLLKDGNYYQELKGHAFEYARGRWDNSKAMASLVEIYDGILKQ